jgi:hypothetical protein
MAQDNDKCQTLVNKVNEPSSSLKCIEAIE